MMTEKKRPPDTYQEAVQALEVAERQAEFWYREFRRANAELVSAEYKFGKLVSLAEDAKEELNALHWWNDKHARGNGDDDE